ncbi:ABC transporter G family member 5 isoform X6 [Manihot esculenta]|uniref:ABC transporter G family member 5 isoform X6 n=1 Tax=Manihot esculenta TaxID=3983 RepID=UPI001CC52C1E|nr:ABC transporter G family member 5 isoform X6 [Manihot esculenta]
MESPKDRSKCNPSEESSIAVSFQLDPLVSSNGNNNPSENNPQEQQRKPNTNNENNKSSKALAKGSSLMLASIIKDFDSKAQDTLKSQDHLNCIIDRHTRVSLNGIRARSIVRRCALAVRYATCCKDFRS